MDERLFAVTTGKAMTEAGCLMFGSDALSVFSGTKSSVRGQTEST